MAAVVEAFGRVLPRPMGKAGEHARQQGVARWLEAVCRQILGIRAENRLLPRLGETGSLRLLVVGVEAQYTDRVDRPALRASSESQSQESTLGKPTEAV